MRPCSWVLAAGLSAGCTPPDAPRPAVTSAEDAASDTDTADERAACGDEGAVRRYCASCAELLAVAPTTPDGPVTLEVSAPFETWCDMTTAGGGWTLVGTNGWGGAWTVRSILDQSTFGTAALDADWKSAAFSEVVANDLLFETDAEYAVYLDVAGGQPYQAFQEGVPMHNCGVGTPHEWALTEGTFSDPDLCSTNLYVHPIDWEGGAYPCGDAEVATGPAWSTRNKRLGCPLNDPAGSAFIADPWDLNPWGARGGPGGNLPLRMWVRG